VRIAIYCTLYIGPFGVPSGRNHGRKRPELSIARSGNVLLRFEFRTIFNHTACPAAETFRKVFWARNDSERNEAAGRSYFIYRR
jgi:hypothetical protein